MIFTKWCGYDAPILHYQISKEGDARDVPVRVRGGVVPVAVEPTRVRTVVRVTANVQRETRKTPDDARPSQ